MRQRLALRRILLQRLFRLQTARPFTSNHTPIASRGGRPQLPFLSIPVASSPRAPRARYFTTEKRRWLRHEGRMFLRYNASLWGAALCVLGVVFLLNQEALEKDHPTPHEWSLLTRMRARGAKSAARDGQDRQVDWVEVLVSCREALRRLEDPGADGAGLRDLPGDGDEPLSVDGVGGAGGKDASGKSENWRRGYYEVLMLLAQASEQLDGWVKDTTRNVVFPPEVVVGPSNPRPRPIPPGAASAPREEDCEVAFEPAENHYLRILATRGFTARQKMDAALRLASFLDYRRLPDAAERMYRRALSLAAEGDAPPQPRVDPRTYTLAGDKPSPPPSENLLTVLTSIALHKARAGDANAALPIFVSVLRARRALPQAPPPGQGPSAAADAGPSDNSLWQRVWALAQPPVYPPPPDDGSRPPAWRHPRELCEEAALNLYIGEILYAASGSGSGSGNGRATNREEGLAWTRDAVDLAEEQLRAVGPSGGGGDASRARHTCRECLGTGLQNWSTMVAGLAREEEEAKKAKKAKADAATPARSVFGFWSDAETTTAADEGRWAAEEKVVKERVRRTRELLVPAEPPAVGLASLLKA
ncbi:hypothetical protein LY76DRAFT_512274 [Colletotrichum caudatum]|nr:hypothetical protein LY76DRAFT_512274 [Colletotrichum caudatum]